MHTEHDGSVDAVSVSEDGLRILVGTSSVSLYSAVCNALYSRKFLLDKKNSPNSATSAIQIYYFHGINFANLIKVAIFIQDEKFAE